MDYGRCLHWGHHPASRDVATRSLSVKGHVLYLRLHLVINTIKKMVTLRGGTKWHLYLGKKVMDPGDREMLTRWQRGVPPSRVEARSGGLPLRRPLR